MARSADGVAGPVLLGPATAATHTADMTPLHIVAGLPGIASGDALPTIPVLLAMVVVLYCLVGVSFMSRHPRTASLIRGHLPG